MDWKAIQKLCVELFLPYTLIEHQEIIMENTLKNVMINDICVYYWICTTIEKTKPLKRWGTGIR